MSKEDTFMTVAQAIAKVQKIKKSFKTSLIKIESIRMV